MTVLGPARAIAVEIPQRVSARNCNEERGAVFSTRPNNTNKSMSDIHLDARREAAESYPSDSEASWLRRQGYAKCYEKMALRLSEKDKVIEGLRDPLGRFLEVAKKAKPFILMHGSLAQAEEVTHAMSLCEELLSSLAPTGTR